MKEDTSRAAPYAALGDAYLQKARETADPASTRAPSRRCATRSRATRATPARSTAMGSLANARHDFRAGLRFGERARAAAPGVVKPYGVIVDAQVELGRYDAAERTLQRMVDLKPNLDSYARVSYFRELHGDLAGAVAGDAAGRLGGRRRAENLAYVQTLLGNLELARGRDSRGASAPTAWRSSRYPGYAPAQAGLARVDAEPRRPGRRDPPLPRGGRRGCRCRSTWSALAEAELAAGRRAAAREDLALVEVQQRLLRRGGVNVDAEMAIVEADHGSPARAVALARRAWAAAPSVRGADALGWALTRAGRPAEGLESARRALRLGSRDALFLYHAGIAARDAGERRRGAAVT